MKEISTVSQPFSSNLSKILFAYSKDLDLDGQLLALLVSTRESLYTSIARRTRNGDVTLDVVDSIKERCLQWIGRQRKLTLILNTNPNPKH